MVGWLMKLWECEQEKGNELMMIITKVMMMMMIANIEYIIIIIKYMRRHLIDIMITPL